MTQVSGSEEGLGKENLMLKEELSKLWDELEEMTKKNDDLIIELEGYKTSQASLQQEIKELKQEAKSYEAKIIELQKSIHGQQELLNEQGEIISKYDEQDKN